MIFNHRFPGVTTGLTFKVFDLWSITISSKPNAFHGLRLDIVASNTSVAESFLKPSPSLRFLPSDLNFLFVTNFPFKRSWWDTLLSLTEGLKERLKEMFLTTWKGLHNFFPIMLTYVPHHFSNNALMLVLSFSLRGFSPAATVFQFTFQFNLEW